MPQIKQYSAPALGLEPTETGIRATVEAGRRAGASFNEVAQAAEGVGGTFARNLGGAVKAAGDQVVAYAEHKEIAHGAAAWAGLNDRLTQQWNDIAKNADPNDPTVAQRFREGVLEPELEKYRDGFLTEGGQRFAESHVESLRNHMFQKTAADMSSLAAKAVEVNVRTTANGLSNTAMTDPSSVPHLLGSVDGMVGDMVNSAPNLKGADSAKARLDLTERMKEQIVKSGAIGAIQNSANPEKTAAEWGAKYPQYINGAELKQLEGNARQQIRASRMDRAYAEHLDKQAKTEQSDAVASDLLKKLYSGDPKEAATVSAKSIINDDRMTLARREHMVNLVNREMKPETDSRISARTSVDIIRAMRDPNADPQKIEDMIFDARTKEPGTPGSLTKADMADLQKQLVDRKTPQGMALAQDRAEFFKRFAPTIDPSMGDVKSLQFGHHTALGMQKMYEAEKAARRMEEDLKRQGKDPHALYDPTSPDFFGRPANIMKYRASLQDSMRYQADISKVTGVEATNIPPTWQWSESRQQFRDPATGKKYDKNLKEVK